MKLVRYLTVAFFAITLLLAINARFNDDRIVNPAQGSDQVNYP